MPNDLNSLKRVLFLKTCVCSRTRRKKEKVGSGVHCIYYEGISRQFLEEVKPCKMMGRGLFEYAEEERN
jgi:hypothetical protein